jgi:hypothetical protein
LVGAVVHISAVVAAPELDLFDVEAGSTQVHLPPVAIVLVSGYERVAWVPAVVLRLRERCRGVAPGAAVVRFGSRVLVGALVLAGSVKAGDPTDGQPVASPRRVRNLDVSDQAA